MMMGMSSKLAMSRGYHEIDEIVDKAVARFRKRGQVLRIESSEATAADGSEALSVMVVIGDEVPLDDGDFALDIIVSIQQALEVSGEPRFPIVSFARQAELMANDGPES
jgi:hypothetical protein